MTAMTDSAKKSAYQEYLQKHDVYQQVRDSLRKLIENRPAQPMLFLANYFDSISSNDKTDRIANALQFLKLTHHSQKLFQNNLTMAYDAISVAKNPNSKKALSNRPGLIGVVFEDLLKAIVSDLQEDFANSLLQRIACRGNEMIPFDVFCYGVTICFVYEEFVKYSENLFNILSKKNTDNVADELICDTVVDAFKDAVDSTVGVHDCDRPAALLEAGHMLRPDKLTSDFLDLQDDKIGKCTMTKFEFLCKMTKMFLSKVNTF